MGNVWEKYGKNRMRKYGNYGKKLTLFPNMVVCYRGCIDLLKQRPHRGGVTGQTGGARGECLVPGLIDIESPNCGVGVRHQNQGPKIRIQVF